jgi:hypothetical protein
MFFRRVTGWVWDHLERLALLAGWVVSSGAFAWAVKAAHILEPYSPLSWVGAAFVGAFLAAVIYRVGVGAYRQQIRSRYDAKLLAQGGAIDPLAKTFEDKRIFLNEFILPSHPLIDGKTFINCQIIGPANILLATANTVNEHKLPVCDAILLDPDARPVNGFGFTNCTFRQCSFQRITLLIPRSEYDGAKDVNWLNWVTPHPNSQPKLGLDSQVSSALSSSVSLIDEAKAEISSQSHGGASE